MDSEEGVYLMHTREFIKSRKFPDIYEFGPDADYWESYLRYERPLVDYVKKKLGIKCKTTLLFFEFNDVYLF